MLQTTLHDFFKIKVAPPKIEIGKSPKVRPTGTKPISPKESPGTPSRKRFRSSQELNFNLQTEITDEMNLQDTANININTAIKKNNLDEISLNEIYDNWSQHKMKSLNNRINYNGQIYPLYDKSAETLFKAIFIDVFLNPLNCNLFNRTELILIQSIFKLSVKSKIIITQLLKWKKPWYRIQNINDKLYESNIDDFPLEEIKLHISENGIFKMLDIENNIKTTLELMNLCEIQDICRQLKRTCSQTKKKLIEQLLNITKMNRSLFSGMTSPRDQLVEIIMKKCGPIIHLSDTALSIINRIFVILYPVQSRFETHQDVCRMIIEVDMGKRRYVNSVVNHYPVFRNRQHVIDYMAAKTTLIDITAAIKVKDWKTVKVLSHKAYNKILNAGDMSQSFIINENDLTLPSYIRRFTASFVWSKVLMLSIDSPKKDPDYATFVSQFLKTLINFNGVVCASIARYYSELSAIEMMYNKNLNECARLVERGLAEKHLSIVVEAELVNRAKKLAARTTKIADISKNVLLSMIQKRKRKSECTPNEIYIEAKKLPSQPEHGIKSVWQIDIDENQNSPGSVEAVAEHYYRRNGFPETLHCEGNLPITLCACAFWNEIYNVPVPGAFVCQYQDAPLDLWSSMFIENRQEEIQERITIFNHMNIDDFCEFMYHNYVTYQEMSSLISLHLMLDHEIKDIIRCLGIKKVIGLCLILLNDYRNLSAGFPDLFLWNPEELKCKIVEVKGPGDSLSVKQKLWINRLMELDVDTEVCYVKAK